MVKKDATLTINIPIALLEMLRNHFETDNISEAINNGLNGFLSSSSYGERMDAFAIHQIIPIEERRNMTKYVVRVTQNLKQAVNTYTSADTCYNHVTVMLANFLCFSGAVPALKTPPETNVAPIHKVIPNKCMHLLRILGSKWNSVMYNAILHILQSSDKIWATSVEPFAGALGIFANFRLAFNEIINDIDLRKINLYRTIQDAYAELLVGMLNMSVTQETFDKNKEALKAGFDLDSASPNVEAATSFLFSNLLSTRNTGITFKALSQEKYRERLDALALLNARMKGVKIHGCYGLDIIKKYMGRTDTVFIIDPPYLDTNVYENTLIIDKKYDNKMKKFDYEEHRQLAQLLHKTHQKQGNDFILFCRTTVTREHDQKTKEITNFAQLEAGDRHMKGRIDDLYWGYGYYYIDVPYDKDGTVERIITSFNFDGATKYGKERA
ncbi:MAG: DNA adenine methylase [Clostridiales bacterium]|nr:DNA adenine methylase [Clostridiales bacterium]